MSQLKPTLAQTAAAQDQPVHTTGEATGQEIGALSLRPALLCVFVASGVALALEILLTRLFSLLFQYHFVFVATSIAICGLGLGGALGAFLRRPGRPGTLAALVQPPRLLQFLAAVLALDSLIFALLPWAGSVALHALLALPAFVLAGLLLASVFAGQPAASARIYAADLLGAAAGALVALPLVAWAGPVAAIQWLALLAAAAAVLVHWAAGNRAWLRSATLGALLIASMLVFSQGVGLVKLDLAALTGAAPDKTMLAVLQDPSQEARIVETVWGPFARLDLVETADPDAQLVFTDGGAGSYMLRFDGDLEALDDLRRQPEYLPFTLSEPANTLILGAGAGKDVLQALLAGSEQVTAVEINPDMLALTRRHAEYNGGVFDLPSVTTHAGDGRSFVETDTGRYDLIYMNLVYSQAAGHEGAALAESYVFTEKALRTYWRHLAPGGRIGLVTHNGFEGSRALLTAIAALQAEGLTLRQALDRVILYQYGSGDPLSRTSVLLVTRDYLDEEALAANAEQAEALGLQMVYAPVLFELPLRDLVLGNADVYTFARNGDYNLTPTSDDRPFFYQLNWGLPAALPALVGITGLLVLGYVSAIVYGQRRAGPLHVGLFAGYFVLLGAAFMLVQLPLVQRFYLLVGDPVLALLITLEGLLLGGSLGSLLSARRRHNLVQLATLAGAGAIALLLVQALLVPLLWDSLLQAALPLRLAAILALTAPLGLLVGIPFPTGLRLAGQWLPTATPALWGVNAVAAVLGSAVAAAGAMLFGFTAMLLLAAALYALALLLLNLAAKRATGA